MKENPYTKLYLTLAVSFVFMYAIMYLNVDDIGHIYFSTTRLYMTVLMTAAMAVIMLLMMQKMYSNKRANTIIITCSILLFSAAFVGVHQQFGIGDKGYLKGMIPHHSIAIMTSEHADIEDPETRALADSISSAQKREIKQMQKILKRLQ